MQRENFSSYPNPYESESLRLVRVSIYLETNYGFGAFSIFVNKNRDGEYTSLTK